MSAVYYYMTRMISAVFGLILAAGCAVQPAGEQPIGQATYASPVTSTSSTLAGLSPSGDCTLAARVPLSIDPSWHPDMVDMIRQAARQWETAVGVDLGPLPIAETDCGRGLESVPGCITLSDSVIWPVDGHGGQISVFVGTIISRGGGSAALRQVVTHEVGHYLGIREHTASGIMSTGGFVSPVVDQTGIDAYSAACHEQ